MGAWKPTLPFGGSTIIATVVDTVLEACSRVILVTGYRGSELAALFRGEKRVTIVENSAWEQGMFSSIRCGAAHVATERFFIALGDMPWIRPQVYMSLLARQEADAVFPTFNGRRGHPVLFSKRIVPAVLDADPGSGRMERRHGTFQHRGAPVGGRHDPPRHRHNGGLPMNRSSPWRA